MSTSVLAAFGESLCERILPGEACQCSGGFGVDVDGRWPYRRWQWWVWRRWWLSERQRLLCQVRNWHWCGSGGFGRVAAVSLAAYV